MLWGLGVSNQLVVGSFLVGWSFRCNRQSMSGMNWYEGVCLYDRCVEGVCVYNKCGWIYFDFIGFESN